MEIIRHKKNIGSSPNYLRAVELSNLKYTWVLCDDDPLDFSDCADVIDAIKSGKYDVLLIGDPQDIVWEGGIETNTKELIDKSGRYYDILGFIPTCIFKTEIYDSKCIFDGYYNVPNIYPHFPFINKTVEENSSVYMSRTKMVYKGGEINLPGFPAINIFIGWINSCQMIKDKKIRIKAIHGSAHYTYWGLLSAIAVEKIRKEGRSTSQLIFPIMSAYAIAFGFSRDLLMLFIAIVLALIPSFIVKRLIKAYLYLKYDIRGSKVPESIYLYLFDEERYKRLH